MEIEFDHPEAPRWLNDLGMPPVLIIALAVDIILLPVNVPGCLLSEEKEVDPLRRKAGPGVKARQPSVDSMDSLSPSEGMELSRPEELEGLASISGSRGGTKAQ